MPAPPPTDPGATVPLSPAATVVLLRDGSSGLEALLLRRTSRMSFAAGHWVFPGGRVDEGDRHGLAADDDLGAARNAAVRETQEEAGLAVDPEALMWFSHWTPPPEAPRRFATWFFAAAATPDDGEVVVDGAEADAWRWMAPSEALDGRDRGEVELSPPTWITLHGLRRFATAAEAIAVLADEDAEHFATRIATSTTELVALYHGDAGYASGDASIPGPRHRLVMSPGPWRYERD